MLTPEKIAEFEARADAGEKPVMDWEQLTDLIETAKRIDKGDDDQ